jgi:hypothetical protein
MLIVFGFPYILAGFPKGEDSLHVIIEEIVERLVHFPKPVVDDFKPFGHSSGGWEGEVDGGNVGFYHCCSNIRLSSKDWKLIRRTLEP